MESCAKAQQRAGATRASPSASRRDRRAARCRAATDGRLGCIRNWRSRPRHAGSRSTSGTPRIARPLWRTGVDGAGGAQRSETGSRLIPWRRTTALRPHRRAEFRIWTDGPQSRGRDRTPIQGPYQPASSAAVRCQTLEPAPRGDLTIGRRHATRNVRVEPVRAKDAAPYSAAFGVAAHTERHLG